VARQVGDERHGQPRRRGLLEAEEDATAGGVHARVGMRRLEYGEESRTRQNVVVNEHEERAVRCACAEVAGEAGAGGRSAQRAYLPGARSREARGDRAGLVGRGAVDDQQLGGAMAIELAEERVEQGGEALSAIVRR